MKTTGAMVVKTSMEMETSNGIHAAGVSFACGKAIGRQPVYRRLFGKEWSVSIWERIRQLILAVVQFPLTDK